MSEFWLWFIRPIAEMLSGMAVVVVAAAVFVGLFKVGDWQRMRRIRKEIKR